MKGDQKNHGFAVLELAVLVFVVVILFAVGAFIYSKQQSKKEIANDSPATSKLSETSEDSQVQPIKSISDLTEAEKSVDELNVDTDNLDTELDKNLASF